MRDVGADVVGVDYRMPLDEATARAGRPGVRCRATSTRRCSPPLARARGARARRRARAAPSRPGTWSTSATASRRRPTRPCSPASSSWCTGWTRSRRWTDRRTPDRTPGRTSSRTVGLDAVVVGGGVAGLVAARELRRAGCGVTVLESDAAPGGAVGRHTVAGLDLDAGAESFATRGGTVAALARRARPGVRRHRARRRSARGCTCRRSGPAAPRGPAGRPGRTRGLPTSAGRSGSSAPCARALDLAAAGPGRRGRLVRRRSCGPGWAARVLDRLVRARGRRGARRRPGGPRRPDAVAPGLLPRARRSAARSPPPSRGCGPRPGGAAVNGMVGGMHTLVDALVAGTSRRTAAPSAPA